MDVLPFVRTPQPVFYRNMGRSGRRFSNASLRLTESEFVLAPAQTAVDAAARRRKKPLKINAGETGYTGMLENFILSGI